MPCWTDTEMIHWKSIREHVSCITFDLQAILGFVFVNYCLRWHKYDLSMILCCFDIKGLKGVFRFFFHEKIRQKLFKKKKSVKSVYFSAVNSSIQLCSIVVLSYHSFVVVQNDLSPFVQILPWSFFWVIGLPRRKKKSNGFLFHTSSRLFIWGVKGTHEDSMSIFRSIVSSYPPVLALHLHSNDIWTFIWKPQVSTLN